MSKENLAEKEVRFFLESEGFTVTRIPEQEQQQTADFLVSDGESIYVVEVKARRDDVTFLSDFKNGVIATREIATSHSNNLSRVIREATRQTQSTPASADALRILAFVPDSQYKEAEFEQMEATLYGRMYIVTPSGSAGYGRPCYYFGFSEFFRHLDLDAALLIGGGIAKLCVNDRSRALGRMRASRIYQIFAECRAICDPSISESAGDAFIADCSLDRRSEDEVLNYIKAKYCLPVAFASNPTIYIAAIQ
jgi:hypothetical protein